MKNCKSPMIVVVCQNKQNILIVHVLVKSYLVNCRPMSGISIIKILISNGCPYPYI